MVYDRLLLFCGILLYYFVAGYAKIMYIYAEIMNRYAN